MAKKAKSKVESEVESPTSEEQLPDAGPTAKAFPSVYQGPSRAAGLLASEALKSIHKRFGKGIILQASEHQARITHRIPTEIWPLDRALGGGWIVGRIHNLFGPKSGGKTTTLLRTIANAQKMCSTCWTYPMLYDLVTGEVFDEPKCLCKKFRETVCAYIDVEGTWDETWARRLGVNVERLLLSQPDHAEQSLDIGEALLRSEQVDVMGLDSIAFLTPAKEIEESTAKETMGVQPRLVGKGIRKFVSALNWAGNQGRRPTIFMTNQIRMKLGVMFGNPETTSGGMAPGFSATSEVRFNAGKYTMEPEPKDPSPGFMARPLYCDMSFRIEKNKGDVPRMEGGYRLILTETETKGIGEVNDEETIVDVAEERGMVTKDKGFWMVGGEKYDTRSKIVEKLLLDKTFKQRFRNTLMRLINPQPV